MVNNSGLPKSEAKRHSSRLASLQVELDKKRSSTQLPGYVKNQWGEYWAADLVDKWLAANEFFCMTTDRSERSAAKLSKASFLLSLNRLDEAEEALFDVDASAPRPDVLRTLAIIAARRGDLAKAKEIAARIGSDVALFFFAISEEELKREYEVGRRF